MFWSVGPDLVRATNGDKDSGAKYVEPLAVVAT